MRRKILPLTLLVLAVIGASEGGFSIKTHRPEAKKESPICRDVREALLKNETSKSEGQWDQSGFTPRDIFRNVSELGKPEAWHELCVALGSLKSEQLSLFQNQILKHQSNLTCASELKTQIRNYWESRKLALPDSSAKPLETVEIPVRSGSEVSSQNLSKGEVALVFEGGPNSESTREIIKILHSRKIRANFFTSGDKAVNSKAIAREISETGNAVGSETSSRAHLALMNIEDAEKEIDSGHVQVALADDLSSNRLFRFPFGETNSSLDEYVKENGYSVVVPNLDSEDWKTRNPSALLAKLESLLAANSGGILSLHDSYEQTALILPSLLDQIAARGLKPVVFVSTRKTIAQAK